LVLKNEAIPTIAADLKKSLRFIVNWVYIRLKCSDKLDAERYRVQI